MILLVAHHYKITFFFKYLLTSGRHGHSTSQKFQSKNLNNIREQIFGPFNLIYISNYMVSNAITD